jgi:CubicO group peptidase (beta-lactamase class C family)
MRHLIFFLTAALISCSPSTAPSDNAQKIRAVETNLLPPVRIADDSTWTIESRMAHYGVPGVSIAVIVDSKIAWSKAYGVMNKERKEPVTTQSLFQAGSISKPVAAYGALRIAASGRVNADEDVNNYLKSWQLPDNEFTKERKVNLKQLLSHTGGVTVHGFGGYPPGVQVPTLVQILNGEAPSNSPPIRVDKLPGVDFRYSGGGYCIMQQMLIDVEGKSFPQIMHEQVLGPLGMQSSTYDQPLPPEKLVLATTGYLPNGSMTEGERHTYPEMAAAGLWTTAEDLARYAIDVQLSFKGESNKVLTREQTQQMLTPYNSQDRGLGPAIEIKSKEVYFGHGGWDEGFSSELIAHRDKGYGVVVLTNSNHPDFISELIRAVALTYEWTDFMPTYTSVASTDSDIQRIVGRYQYDSDNIVQIFAEEGKLYYQYPGLEPWRLFKVSDSTFARRERTALIQFMNSPVDGKSHLVFRSGKDTIIFNRPKVGADEKVPFDWFLEGDYARAKMEYQNFVKSNPKDGVINEFSIADRGYSLMDQGKLSQAKELFRINMELYASSDGVYEDYGIACMKNGDTEEAIKYFKKALAIDPKNQGALNGLATLEKK